MSSRAFLSLLLLAAALAACSPRRSEPTQQPAVRDQTAPAPNRPATPPGSPSALEKSVSAAADLFNRGENDLACEQVKKALSLASQPGTDGSAAVRQQLSTFRSACEPF